MKVELHPSFQALTEAREAESILQSCVHCGLCTATCPTYREVGDERDGPRGRIYLLKQFLEQGRASNKTVLHLDRCLTCRSCETHCPSMVDYGRLIDIGRGMLEKRVRRPLWERILRWCLRRVLPYEHRFITLLRLGQLLRPVLPAAIKSRVPKRQQSGQLPKILHDRRMLITAACAQTGTKPNINTAAARVLHRLGITLEVASGAGCCGALSFHLGAQEEGRRFMRRNIDAWWPQITAGAEAIVSTASGCGVMIKEYGALLNDDSAYAEKAQKISALTMDISEILISANLADLNFEQDDRKTAIHCPCTLQHGQKLPTIIDEILSRAGIDLVANPDKHICCGSAGTYSILQPGLSQSLLDKKLDALNTNNPQRIVTGNIGCQLHLETKSIVPVKHWIEVLDELL